MEAMTHRRLFLNREPPPCKDCAVRHTACHQRCKQYTAWKQEVDRVRTERQKYLAMPKCKFI